MSDWCFAYSWVRFSFAMIFMTYTQCQQHLLEAHVARSDLRDSFSALTDESRGDHKTECLQEFDMSPGRVR